MLERQSIVLEMEVGLQGSEGGKMKRIWVMHRLKSLRCAWWKWTCLFSKLTFIGMNIVLEAALLAVSATESDFNLNLHHTANTRPKLKQAHSSLTFFYDISIFFGLCGWFIYRKSLSSFSRTEWIPVNESCWTKRPDRVFGLLSWTETVTESCSPDLIPTSVTHSPTSILLYFIWQFKENTQLLFIKIVAVKIL